MNEFISRYQSQLHGVLTGFDRLVLRGHLALNNDPGMKGYLWANQIAWKDYASHVEQMSRRVKEASLATLETSQRPVRYLANGEESKEQMARDIARKDNITSGPICAFTAVEPCWTWAVRGDRTSQKLQLVRSLRKCLFVYHYWIDAVFGFMSARLQTWFPFTLYFYLNGREWLALQMDAAAIDYQRQDNCFPWIEDFGRAQALMNDQLKTNWPQALNAATQRVHPLLSEICALYPMNYYWTCFQSEWTMDIVFRDPQQLRHLYPQLIHLGVIGLSSPDVMRFMGKKVSRQADSIGPHAHEVITDLKVRPQGVRIKHRLGKNSIKLYDKAYTERGAVLRPEVTINAPGQFRVYRHKTGDDEGPMHWRPMRAGMVSLSGLCIHLRRKIWPCSRPSVEASSPSMECAIEICRLYCFPRRPPRTLKPDAGPLPSAGNSACCAHTGLFRNCLTLTATKSPIEAGSSSMPSFRHNALPHSNLRKLPPKIVAA